MKINTKKKKGLRGLTRPADACAAYWPSVAQWRGKGRGGLGGGGARARPQRWPAAHADGECGPTSRPRRDGSRPAQRGLPKPT